MKRFWLTIVPLALLISLVGGLLVTLTASSAPTITAATSALSVAQGGQTDPEKITVYVTRTGAKYHRDGCRYLSRSKIPMSLKEAAKRFEPCKVCRPPVLSR